MADSDDILQKILNEEDTTNINTEDINIDEILQETTDIQLNDDVALDFLDEKGKEFSELANKQGMSSASSLNAMLSSQERIEESRSKQKEQTEKLKKPIDFVQYMETDHIKEENKKISSTFYLKIIHLEELKVDLVFLILFLKQHSVQGFLKKEISSLQSLQEKMLYLLEII